MHGIANRCSGLDHDDAGEMASAFPSGTRQMKKVVIAGHDRAAEQGGPSEVILIGSPPQTLICCRCDIDTTVP